MTTVTDQDHQQDPTPEHAGPAEVVHPAVPDQAADLAARQRAAVDAAAEHALSPGVPGRDEFLNLCLQAKLLSMSAALQPGLRDNPHLCLHVVLIARALGLDPASAVNLIDFIPDDRDHPERGGQLSLSPQFRCGQVRRLGLGSIELLELTEDRAVAVALRPGGGIEKDLAGNPTAIHGEIGRSEFTWADAQVAGLVDRRCQPGAHWIKDGTRGRNRDERCDCRTGWRTYPKRMLGWRAKGYACDDHFPEASVGLYSPEELGAVTDEQGRMIDPANVELPAGYEPPPPPPKPEVPEADLDEIRATIATLDADGRQALKEAWARARIAPLGSEAFTPQNARAVLSILRGVVSQQKRAGWDEDAARHHAAAFGLYRLFAAYAGVDSTTPPAAHEPPPAPASTPETPREAPAAPEVPPAPQADAQPADDPVERIIAQVKRMTPDQVLEELKSRGKGVGGNPDARAKRLAAVMCQEWAENHPGEAPAR